jgi:hypothetical protein
MGYIHNLRPDLKLLFLQVLFEGNGKGIVCRDTFEWNKSDFSREFKSTTDATQFIEKFQALTTFDRVHQVVLVNEANEDNPHETLSNEDAISQNQGRSEASVGEKRSNDTEQLPPAKKLKKKNNDIMQMGNIVDSKKVGKVIYVRGASCLYSIAMSFGIGG